MGIFYKKSHQLVSGLRFSYRFHSLLTFHLSRQPPVYFRFLNPSGTLFLYRHRFLTCLNVFFLLNGIARPEKPSEQNSSSGKTFVVHPRKPFRSNSSSRKTFPLQDWQSEQANPTLSAANQTANQVRRFEPSTLPANQRTSQAATKTAK